MPVKVEVPCRLPPKPSLPTVKSSDPKSEGLAVCYDKANAAKLLLVLTRLKRWQDEATAACK